MSNGDFEVMPRGTMEEIVALRALSNRLISVMESNLDPTAKWDKTRPLILDIKAFYADHVEKYPVQL